MVTAALPLALESVRQALLIPPPAYVSEFEPALSDKAAGLVARLDALSLSGAAKLGAHVNLIQAAIANVAARASDAPFHSDEFPFAGLYAAFDAVIADAAVKRDMLISLRPGWLAQIPAQARPQIKRSIKRAEKVLGDYHNDLVEAYYQLRAVDAACDPDSSLIVTSASSAQEIDTFFSGLRA